MRHDATTEAVSAHFAKAWVFDTGIADGRVGRFLSVSVGTLTGIAICFGLSMACRATEMRQIIRLRGKR